jgi:hypothetical protein
MPGREKRSDNLNIRISDTGRYILTEFQELLGLSQASVIEMLLREEARRRGIAIPGTEQFRQQQLEEGSKIQRLSDAMGPRTGSPPKPPVKP